MALLGKTNWFADMGIETQWNACEASLNSCRVVASDDFAQMLFDLSCTTVGMESTRLLPYLFGWPNRQVLLLDDDHRESTIRELERDARIAGICFLLLQVLESATEVMSTVSVYAEMYTFPRCSN